MATVRVDLNGAGIKADALTSSAVQAACMAAATELAERARSRGIMVEGRPGDVPLPVDVIDAGSSSRARALVFIAHPSGLAVEAKHRLLGGSA